MKDALTGNKGQGVLEIVIALGILSITLTSAIILVFGGQSLLIDTQLGQQALQIAMRNLETTQVSAGENFDDLTSSSSTASRFLEEIIVENAGNDTKKITSRVSWQTDPARLQKVEFSALATNWRLLREFGGDSCGGGVAGDWQNPITGGTVDLGPGNEATGLSPRLLEVLDEVVAIPMGGAVDSLNVACAASIALYEVTLGRKRKLLNPPEQV